MQTRNLGPLKDVSRIALGGAQIAAIDALGLRDPEPV